MKTKHVRFIPHVTYLCFRDAIKDRVLQILKKKKRFLLKKIKKIKIKTYSSEYDDVSFIVSNLNEEREKT